MIEVRNNVAMMDTGKGIPVSMLFDTARDAAEWAKAQTPRYGPDSDGMFAEYNARMVRQGS